VITGLYTKLIAAAAVLALLAGGLLWFGAHERGIGAAGVQARWDEAKSVQAQAVAKAEADATNRVTTMRNQFDALSAKYEAATHAQAPSIADSVAAGVRDGSVRLRDASVCTGGDQVSAATARSRAADAAATAALAQRVADSLAAVSVGDRADVREQQLREQVIGLQGVLRAEREH
jgi:hypothetical protein